jgi:peptidyl-prolyl cis-trans isomerase B (cyclophilin B)|tara:strand:+ start:7867 stop:8553 length:687 start_codon:yes stop_codon:yes gene_type:complete
MILITQSPSNAVNPKAALTRYDGLPACWLARVSRFDIGTVYTAPLSNFSREQVRLNISANIETSKGAIRLSLYPEQAPVTVANFVNLSLRKYYNGLNFHRVINGFMIQGGCPLGSGTGGPGYNFEDEFSADLRHDAAGKLSMANAGPGTNGSQFFITHVPTPHLDDAHSIFGAVVSSADQQVVDSIEQGDKIIAIGIEGDYQSLLEQNTDRIAEWNREVDANFPNLAT